MAYDVTLARGALAGLLDIRAAAGLLAETLGPQGIALPERPNTAAGDGALRLHWLGPAHWLLEGEEARLAALAPVLASAGLSAVVVSDAYLAFALDGPDVGEVLAQATPLDLDPAVFPSDGATFTEFFGQTALIARDPAGAGFRVLVARSYADYLEDCLRAAVG